MALTTQQATVVIDAVNAVLNTLPRMRHLPFHKEEAMVSLTTKSVMRINYNMPYTLQIGVGIMGDLHGNVTEDDGKSAPNFTRLINQELQNRNYCGELPQVNPLYP